MDDPKFSNAGVFSPLTMKPKRVLVTKERLYRPHQEFLHAAQIHLDHFDQKIVGYDYSLLSSFLLSAFSLEAYLNSVGPILEKGWEDFDRATVWVKLRHVFALVKIEPDFSQDPLQAITELFKFRNAIAHPRDATIKEEKECTVENYQKELYAEPQPKIMAFASRKSAMRCLESVREVISEINDALPAPDPCPFYSIGWSSGASLQSD